MLGREGVKDVVGLYVFSDRGTDLYRISGLALIRQEYSPEELGRIASKVFDRKGIRFENGAYYSSGRIYEISHDSSFERILTKDELLRFHSTRLENVIDSVDDKKKIN
jgi:hypothetical protein